MMKTIVIDYSKPYYLNILDTSVPDKYGGKFVQIWHGEEEYIVLSPKEFKKYHADIVELFSRDRGIAGAYDSEEKRFDVFEPGWVIKGGGKFEIDKKERLLRIYDDSMAYGRFSGEGLKERLAETKEFSGFRIVID